MGLGQSKAVPQQQQLPLILPPLPPKPTISEDEKIAKTIEVEKITIHLEQNIQLFVSKQRKYETKIESMKAKAKEYLEDGKQKQAKKMLQMATKLRKQLQSIETRRKVIQSKRNEIEIHEMNKETIEALDSANTLTKQNYTEKIQEHLIEARQQKIIRQQIDEKMKDILDDESEQQAANDMLNQLQAEIMKDKKKQIAKKEIRVQAEDAKQRQFGKVKVEDAKNRRQANLSHQIDALLDNL